MRGAVHIRRTIVSLQTERILLGRAVNRSETGVITLDQHDDINAANFTPRGTAVVSMLVHFPSVSSLILEQSLVR